MYTLEVKLQRLLFFHFTVIPSAAELWRLTADHTA
jgi:hypothetical protein